MHFVLYLTLARCIRHPYSVELDKDNLFQYIGTNKSVFVHFYADLCQHCIKAAPEWNEIVRMYRPLAKHVFATVDCDRHKGICATLESASTPGFHHYAPHSRRGAPFAGERNVVHFAKWIREETGDLPYSRPGTLMFAREGDDLSEIRDFAARGYAFAVVDSPRQPRYNHTALRNVEAVRDDVMFRAVRSGTSDAATLCGGSEKQNCMVLIAGNRTIEYSGEVDEDRLFDFLELNVADDAEL